MQKLVTLIGISLRGKNRVKEAFMMLGTREWRILEQQGTSTTTTQDTAKLGHWVDYRTRIVSTANKVNLSFKTVLPALQGQLVHSLGGIL